MFKKILMVLGYLLTASAIFLPFVFRKTFFRFPHILFCLGAWIIGLIILIFNENRKEFKDYLWSVNYLTPEQRRIIAEEERADRIAKLEKAKAEAEAERKYFESLSPEAKEMYLIRKDLKNEKDMRRKLESELSSARSALSSAQSELSSTKSKLSSTESELFRYRHY